MRGGAVAARRAHNPKVAGSSPAPATFDEPEAQRLRFGFEYVPPASLCRLGLPLEETISLVDARPHAVSQVPGIRIVFAG